MSLVPPRRSVRFGLWPRLALLLAVAVLVAAAVPAWQAYRDLRKVAWRDLRVRATAVAEAAASNAGFCLSGAETECRQLTDVLLQIDDVAWACVVDPAGEIPAGGAGFASDLGPRGFEAVRYHGGVPARVETRRARFHGRTHLAVVVPVVAAAPSGDLDLFLGAGRPGAREPLGAVELGFSLESTMKAIGASLERTVLLTALVIMVALLVAAFFARLLTGPLYRMTRVSETVAQGDLRANLQVDSRDEIGLLCETFNGMIRSMRSSLQRMSESAERIDAAASDLVELMSSQRAGADQNLATVSATMATLSEVVASSSEVERRGRAALDLAERTVLTSEHVAVSSHRILDDAVAGIERVEPVVVALAPRARDIVEGSDRLDQLIEGLSSFADRFHDLSLGASQRSIEIRTSEEQDPEAALRGIVSAARIHARETQQAVTGIRRVVTQLQRDARRASSGADDCRHALDAVTVRLREGADALRGRSAGLKDGTRASRRIAELMREQLEQMQEVLRGVENVRRATSQFNAAADRTLETAKALGRVSAQMRDLLGEYRLS